VARSPRQPCARFYRTVKLACVVNDPFGVVIVIKPLVAPSGTLTKTEGFNGNLYGMTQNLGYAKGMADGAIPNSVIQTANGNLYETTEGGPPAGARYLSLRLPGN
jgi:hypothetical protein